LKKIDARGKQCPEPVMMTKAAISEDTEDVEVIVDNDIASQNVTRLLGKLGFSHETSKKDTDIYVNGHKDISFSAVAVNSGTQSPLQMRNRAVFISRSVMGGNDEELGEVLIKAFLGTLAQMQTPPARIALMNEGIKLALEGTSTCEYLKELENKGVEVLVCGTCSNHFGLTEKVGVGIISNMFDITEGLLEKDSVISI